MKRMDDLWCLGRFTQLIAVHFIGVFDSHIKMPLVVQVLIEHIFLSFTLF